MTGGILDEPVLLGVVVVLPPEPPLGGRVTFGFSLEKLPPGVEKLRLPLEKLFESGEV